MAAARMPPFSMEFAQAGPGGFASSYEKGPKGNYAFVVPGDEELFVGGGALNGAVGKLLMQQGRQPSGFVTAADGSINKVQDAAGKMVDEYRKEKCPYRPMQQAAFEKARLTPLRMQEQWDNLPEHILHCYARSYNTGAHPFGTVFINVLAKDFRPLSPQNVAVLYTVGALGRNKKAEGEGEVSAEREALVKTNPREFVHEIYLTGANVIRSVVSYNKDHAKGALPRIEVVRVPVIAGGTFIHPQVDPSEVALALLWGIHQGLVDSADEDRPAVELMPGKAMEDAYAQYRRTPEVADYSGEGKVYDLFRDLKMGFDMSFAFAPPGGFAASYERDRDRNFVMLVPGDEELFVGGGALNGAIGQLLMKEADQTIGFDVGPNGQIKRDSNGPIFNKPENPYLQVHQPLFARSRQQPFQLVLSTQEALDRQTNLIFSAARVYNDGEHPFGAAFVDIFDRRKRPFRCQKNVGLVYTVGALGRNKKAEGEGPVTAEREALVKDDPREFVEEIYHTGFNVLRAVAMYNQNHAGDDFPKIEEIRVPVIAGGTFLHPSVDQSEVALALLWGVTDALTITEDQHRPAINLMPGAPMEQAYSWYRQGLHPFHCHQGRSIKEVPDLFGKLSKTVPMAFAELAPGMSFASSYDKNQARTNAFLVPGDEELFVGGGALNGATGQLLLKEARHSIAFEMHSDGTIRQEFDQALNRNVPVFTKHRCLFKKRQSHAFEEARREPLSLVSGNRDPWADIDVMYTGCRVYDSGKHPFGALCISIFREDKQPFDNPCNVGLLYTVGALGRNKKAEGEGEVTQERERLVKADPREFVHEIYRTGWNIAAGVSEYNSQHVQSQLPRLDMIRIPLVAGGTFINPKVSPTEVGLALLWGLDQGLMVHDVSVRPHVELMPDKDLKAAHMLYCEGMKPSHRRGLSEKGVTDLFQYLDHGVGMRWVTPAEDRPPSVEVDLCFSLGPGQVPLQGRFEKLAAEKLEESGRELRNHMTDHKRFVAKRSFRQHCPCFIDVTTAPSEDALLWCTVPGASSKKEAEWGQVANAAAQLLRDCHETQGAPRVKCVRVFQPHTDPRLCELFLDAFLAALKELKLPLRIEMVRARPQGLAYERICGRRPARSPDVQNTPVEGVTPVNAQQSQLLVPATTADQQRAQPDWLVQQAAPDQQRWKPPTRHVALRQSSGPTICYVQGSPAQRGGLTPTRVEVRRAQWDGPPPIYAEVPPRSKPTTTYAGMPLPSAGPVDPRQAADQRLQFLYPAQGSFQPHRQASPPQPPRRGAFRAASPRAQPVCRPYHEGLGSARAFSLAPRLPPPAHSSFTPVPRLQPSQRQAQRRQANPLVLTRQGYAWAPPGLGGQNRAATVPRPLPVRQAGGPGWVGFYPGPHPVARCAPAPTRWAPLPPHSVMVQQGFQPPGQMVRGASPAPQPWPARR